MRDLIILCFIAALAGVGVANDCPTLCACKDGLPVLSCSGRTELVNHTEIPKNITSIAYESCSFVDMTSELMYTEILELSIHHSDLMSISDGVFREMKMLKTLDLRHNALSTLSQNAFSGLDALSDLYLGHNRLVNLPDGLFASMPFLVRVELDENAGFQFTPQLFFNASSTLTQVSCERCVITDIISVTQALGSVPSLKDLILSGNNLNLLPHGAFVLSPQLETLRLDSCSIKTLNESSFIGLSRLHKLYLSHNRIQVLASNIFSAVKDSLSYVFLNNNELKSLDEDLLRWSSLKELHIEHNPWNCDCQLNWIHNYGLDIDSTNTTCAEPEALRGVSVSSYQINCDGPSTFVLAIVIPIIVICLAVIGCFIYRFVQTLIIRRRSAREKSSFRYSAVYRETVEPASSKQRSGTAQSYNLKQDSKV